MSAPEKGLGCSVETHDRCGSFQGNREHQSVSFLVICKRDFVLEEHLFILACIV